MLSGPLYGERGLFSLGTIALPTTDQNGEMGTYTQQLTIW
jgi:hypothetical protein